MIIFLLIVFAIFYFIAYNVNADRFYLRGRLMQACFNNRITYDEDDSIQVHYDDGSYDVYIGGDATRWNIKYFKKHGLPMEYEAN